MSRFYCQDCHKEIENITECKANGHVLNEIGSDGYNRHLLVGAEKKIRSFSTNDVDLRLIVSAKILGTDQVNMIDIEQEWRCPICEDLELRELKGYKDNWREMPCTPPSCKEHNCAMTLREHTQANIQKVLIQEPQDEVIGASPITMTSYLFGERCLTLQPGDDVYIEGLLRTQRLSARSNIFRREFDITRHTPVKQTVEMPDPSEIAKYSEYNVGDLIQSYSPEIYGMELSKEAMLISLIGGNCNKDVRGDINTFLTGDPSVGKSKLLSFVTELVAKSSYTSGRSSSTAGLLGGVDNLPDGSRIPRAGPVVLNSGGVVCIDEMDKMSQYDSSGLHEAMSKQTFSLNKIGINVTWDTRTTIIGAANPRGSRYDTSATILENIKMSESLLSRFGLIILIRDIPNKEVDRAIMKHILKTRSGNLVYPLDTDNLRKYINYAKTFTPVMTTDAENTLLDYYLQLRESNEENRIAIDTRTGEDLSTIATAYAKMRFSKETTEDDAKKSINLLHRCLQSFNVESRGELNENIGNTREVHRGIFIIHTIRKEDLYIDNLKPLVDGDHFISILDAKNEVDRIKSEGWIKEGIDGKLTLTKKGESIGN